MEGPSSTGALSWLVLQCVGASFSATGHGNKSYGRDERSWVESTNLAAVHGLLVA